jgi:type II secretion system protein D
MAFIEELVAILDSAAPEATIKIFQIENGDAASIQDMLTSLIPTNVDGTPGPQLPGAANEEALIPIRFAIDVRTNCIIAAGSPKDMEIVEALVECLDREDSLARKNNVYFLKNMKATDVAATVMNYINEVLRVQIAAVENGVISNFQQVESAVIVTPHEESNSLIISATPKYYDEIMDLITELDKSPPQVVIKVLIAEVTLVDNKEWAAELGLQDPLLFKRSATAGTNGPGILFGSGPLANLNSTTQGSPGTIGSQLLSNFGPGISSGGLAFSASSDYISIMLRALQEKNRLEVLSSPQITAMNNTRASLSVGQDVPRPVGTDTYQSTITTRFVDVPVVMELTIIPTISPEGTVVMGVNLKKDKVGTPTYIDGKPYDSLDTSNLVTIVSAADNQTVVLGGLITKSTEKKRSKVPVLGDVPIMGKMFRHEYDTTTRKELLVILTPRIIKDQNDMERVKQMEFARMNWCLSSVVQVYGEFGAYDVVSESPFTGSAPVITPAPVRTEDLKPIDPQFLAPTLPKRN